MYFRPRVEGFEDRVVPAAVLTPAQMAPAAAAPVNPSGLLNLTNVQLTSLNIVNGVLQGAGTLTGTLAGAPFSNVPFSFTLTPSPAPGQCAILNLHLDPIHISLLGLHVDTSPICLDITATNGGGLLGSLLCSLSSDLSGILASPTALQNLLGQVLSGVLSSPKAAHGNGPAQPTTDVCTGECDVLDLTLGPVHLNLLGLHVDLDNCSGGPVQVCVSATASEGLLGSVLCSLDNTNLSLAGISQLISSLLPA